MIRLRSVLVPIGITATVYTLTISAWAIAIVGNQIPDPEIRLLIAPAAYMAAIGALVVPGWVAYRAAQAASGGDDA